MRTRKIGKKGDFFYYLKYKPKQVKTDLPPGTKKSPQYGERNFSISQNSPCHKYVQLLLESSGEKKWMKTLKKRENNYQCLLLM